MKNTVVSYKGQDIAKMSRQQLRDSLDALIKETQQAKQVLMSLSVWQFLAYRRQVKKHARKMAKGVRHGVDQHFVDFNQKVKADVKKKRD
jgi:hypothetical protein